MTEGGREGTYGRCQVGSGGRRAGGCAGHLEHWQSPESQFRPVVSGCMLIMPGVIGGKLEMFNLHTQGKRPNKYAGEVVGAVDYAVTDA